MSLSFVRVALISSAILFEAFMPNANMIIVLGFVGIAGVFIVDRQQRQTAKEARQQGTQKGIDLAIAALTHPSARQSCESRSQNQDRQQADAQ
jgi:hypothetical protein